MDRRSFLRTGGIAALASAVAPGRALATDPASPQAQAAFVPAVDFEGASFGSGPRISNRLNQGPFPQYAPELVVPDSDVMMATVAHREPNRGFGKGLITYIVADQGLAEIDATDKLKEVERLTAFPLGDKIYIRPTWREIQPVPGRLRFPPTGTAPSRRRRSTASASASGSRCGRPTTASRRCPTSCSSACRW